MSVKGYNKRGLLVRLIYLIITVGLYVLTFGSRLGCIKEIVLCYHGVLLTQKGLFRRQVMVLDHKSNMSNTHPETCNATVTGKARILITFDDAFANLLDNALPILEEFHIPAIIFVVADNLGCRPCWRMPDGHPDVNEMTMTADQLTKISNNPLLRIGSHTLTHPDLTKISREQLKLELADSKAKLEKLVRYPIEDLALPHGSYNNEVLSMAEAVGYKRIYSLDPKPINPKKGSVVLGRFPMSPDVWKIEFILTCAGTYAWLYPWRKLLNILRQIIR